MPLSNWAVPGDGNTEEEVSADEQCPRHAEAAGEGWTKEELLSVPLACFMYFPKLSPQIQEVKGCLERLQEAGQLQQLLPEAPQNVFEASSSREVAEFVYLLLLETLRPAGDLQRLGGEFAELADSVHQLLQLLPAADCGQKLWRFASLLRRRPSLRPACIVANCSPRVARAAYSALAQRRPMPKLEEQSSLFAQYCGRCSKDQYKRLYSSCYHPLLQSLTPNEVHGWTTQKILRHLLHHRPIVEILQKIFHHCEDRESSALATVELGAVLLFELLEFTRCQVQQQHQHQQQQQQQQQLQQQQRWQWQSCWRWVCRLSLRCLSPQPQPVALQQLRILAFDSGRPDGGLQQLQQLVRESLGIQQEQQYQLAAYSVDMEEFAAGADDSRDFAELLVGGERQQQQQQQLNLVFVDESLLQQLGRSGSLAAAVLQLCLRLRQPLYFVYRHTPAIFNGLPKLVRDDPGDRVTIFSSDCVDSFCFPPAPSPEKDAGCLLSLLRCLRQLDDNCCCCTRHPSCRDDSPLIHH